MAFALAVLAVLATVAPEPAAAQTVTTFISNTGQTTNFASSLVQATEFTTGTGTYTLSSVGIFIPFSSLVGTPAVKIYGDTGGNPGTTLLATMTNPGTFADNAVHTFTAPANTTLSASTTYWVVTSNSAATNGQGFRVGTIANTNLDSGTAAGWSIGAARLKNNIANTSWTPSSRRIRFAIRGTGGTTTNNPPTVATAIPDQSATAGTAFSYVFPANTFSDADTGDTLSYTATKTDDTALPTWLAFAASTRTFSGTPQAADIATVAVKVTASDGNGGSVSDAFDITVAADTTPPTLTSADVEITDALSINLVFSEDLQLSNPPALSAFTVTVDGSAATVSSVGVPGSVMPQNELWLQLSTAIRQRQAVVVTYTDATSGDDTAAIQDTAGNDAATFTTGMDGVPAVTNNSTVTNTVPADWSLIPNGLSTGDKFRLLFLSSTKRVGSSSDIATYNTFIQTRAAAGHTDIQDYSADFRAVGCTADTDARDNTKTTYTTTDKGVPIYWLNGAKAADQYEDFYDGSWDDEANDKNESGTNGLDTSQNVNYPWTGCDHDGTEAVTGADSFALGTGLADARVGRPNSSVSGHGPLNGQTNRSDFQHNPLYGLSEVFQVAAAVVVPNNPPTVATAIPDQTATAGTAFSYAFPDTTFTDADTSDTLTYTATKTGDTALPTWLAFAAGTRTFSGTPQAADTGTVAVKVTASDSNGGSVSDTFDITVAPDPNAHCNALDTSELWCGTLTVGRGSNVAYGYNASLSLGSVAPRTFTHGGATITVNVLLYNGNRLGFYMSSALGAGDFSLEIGTGGAKRSFAMNDPGTETEFFNHGLSWSANETVPVKLLLVNTPATGAPAITGTAQVGQTLTATLGDIADVDGLPDPFLTDANTSFQWIRVATDNSETDIGAMAGAYTLVADDQGTTIKVKVSFTGNNGFAETRTSAATAAVSATAAVVPANWSLKPTGRAAGDQFRLLFLSSTKRNGSSTDIATYNTFVQERAAAGHADIRTYSAGFRAVGCTSDVDARDNTRTTGTGVPIYWLNGAKAADNYADFYDGSWDDEVNDKNESGTNGPDTSQSVNRPFTGCEHNGTEALDGSISQGFGAAGGTKVGRPNSSSALHGPLSSNAVTGTANTRPLYGLSEVFQVAAAVVVPNNPPAFSADTAARSVAENTAAGQNVGAALTATDADSDTLTYTLEGTDAASFDIVSGSGQIRTRTGVTYNHEAKSTHTVVVKADDGNGGTDTVTVTITVTDVDEPPGQPAAPSVSATAGSTTSLDVTWTAPTNTGPAIASYDLQYRAGTSGNFTNGPQNVTGTSAAIGSLAADTSYEVQVRATNAEGDGDWSVAGTGRTTATSAPGAPTGLTATASGATQIDLSWSAPAAPAAPPSPATRSRSRPTAPPAGPTRSPTPTAPPRPTPTPGLPPATPATTASPPSTPTAPAPPPTSTAPPPSRSLPPSAMWSRCRSPAPPTRCKSPGPLPTTPASPPSPVTTSATEKMSIGRPCGRTPPAPPSSLPT